MIIAIGESLIAMGLGATDHPLSTPLPAAAVLGWPPPTDCGGSTST
ncbi:hypothetical protein [Streptomyces fulvoviolaceus]